MKTAEEWANRESKEWHPHDDCSCECECCGDDWEKQFQDWIKPFS